MRLGLDDLPLIKLAPPDSRHGDAKWQAWRDEVDSLPPPLDRDWTHEIYCRMVRKALVYNALCLNIIGSGSEGYLRVQMYIPVSRRHRQRRWGPLPEEIEKMLRDVPSDFWDMARRLPTPPEWTLSPDEDIWPARHLERPAPPTSAHWAWVELCPVPRDSPWVDRWLDELRTLGRPETRAPLEFSLHGEVRAAEVTVDERGDLCIWFGPERVPLRPPPWECPRGGWLGRLLHRWRSRRREQRSRFAGCPTP
jgi:hypothetical protein